MNKWLIEDAIYLKKQGRYKGSLALFLCFLDAMAAEKYPEMGHKQNGRRYKKFIKVHMKILGMQKFKFKDHGASEERFSSKDLSEFLYHKLRCEFVHAGGAWDEESELFQIDYSNPPRTYLFANFNENSPAGWKKVRVKGVEKFKVDVHWIFALIDNIITLEQSTAEKVISHYFKRNIRRIMAELIVKDKKKKKAKAKKKKKVTLH